MMVTAYLIILKHYYSIEISLIISYRNDFIKLLIAESYGLLDLSQNVFISDFF